MCVHFILSFVFMTLPAVARHCFVPSNVAGPCAAIVATTLKEITFSLWCTPTNTVMVKVMYIHVHCVSLSPKQPQPQVTNRMVKGARSGWIMHVHTRWSRMSDRITLQAGKSTKQALYYYRLQTVAAIFEHVHVN